MRSPIAGTYGIARVIDPGLLPGAAVSIAYRGIIPGSGVSGLMRRCHYD